MSHAPRPRNSVFEIIDFKRRFPCDPPLTALILISFLKYILKNSPSPKAGTKALRKANVLLQVTVLIVYANLEKLWRDAKGRSGGSGRHGGECRTNTRSS